MATVVLAWDDMDGVNRLMNAMSMMSGHQKHLAIQRAVNHTGDRARTRVVRALARQTGLKQAVIRRAVKVQRAWGASADAGAFVPGGGSLVYVMTARGGEIALRHFAARETRKGVTAAPRGTRQLFPGTFMMAGRFPNRVEASGLNGHVYKREGKTRLPIAKQKSDVVIPVEMVRGETLAAFETATATLTDRVMHEINRLAPDIFT